ncbi:hypothetical protein [Microbacterium enclense]|uniref:hypothetical protein n=1 Tax=Microbacterium enclense TaxID=993073 RepID=UPI003F8003FF
MTEYASQRSLRELLKALYEQGNWEPSWELVTSVRSFRKHTLVVASDANVTAKLSFDVPTSVPSFAAVNLGANLSISSGTASKWQVKNGTPLYESLIVKEGFFGGVRVDSKTLDEPVPSTGPGPDGKIVVSSPDAAELDLP